MDQAEDCIAILHGLGDDADREEIVYLIHGDALALQFLIDGVQALDAPVDAGGDVVFDKALVQDGVDIAEKLFALLAVRFDGGTDLIVTDGIDIAKRQVLEFTANFAHAETVSEGGINVEGFSSDSLLPFRLKMFQGAHVVETIGEFDEHHANIGDHGEEHFSDVFRLAILAIGKLDLVDFGDAVDDVGNLFAEGFSNFAAGHGGIFDCIVKQAGGNGGRIQLHFG